MIIKFDKDKLMEAAFNELGALYLKGDSPEAKKSKQVRKKDVLTKKRIYLWLAKQIAIRSIIYTPVDTGRLVNSIKIVTSSNGSVSIVYDATYAIFVHEVIDNQHAFPSRAKFLEDAAMEVLSLWSKYLTFTFSLSTYGDGGIALHLDRINIEDFKANISKIKANKLAVDEAALGNLDALDKLSAVMDVQKDSNTPLDASGGVIDLGAILDEYLLGGEGQNGDN